MTTRGVESRRETTPRELSSTEHELIGLVLLGCTNRQIGIRLRLAEKTVENHLTRLFAKVGCRSRYGLVSASLTEPVRRGTA